jgi:broad specificity phosphatase PhoE
MTRLLLVRHARPAAGFDADLDPGLDEVGREQADALADRLGARSPLPVISSPLRRARETAAPLGRRWGCRPVIEEAVGEIPAPIGAPTARAAWLRERLDARWDEVEDRLLEWRAQLLEVLVALGEDTVVVTHYVAINTAVGAATGDERLVSCAPGHASTTELEVTRGVLALRSGPAP